MKDLGDLQDGQAEPESTASDTAGMDRFSSRHLPELPPTIQEAACQLVDGSYGVISDGVPAGSGQGKPPSGIFNSGSVSIMPDDFQAGTLSHAVAEHTPRELSGRHNLLIPPMPPPDRRIAQVHGAQTHLGPLHPDGGLQEADADVDPNAAADAAVKAADEYLRSPPRPGDQQEQGVAAQPSSEASKEGAAQMAGPDNGRHPSVIMRQPAGPSVRLEVLEKPAPLLSMKAAGSKPRAAQPAEAPPGKFHPDDTKHDDGGLTSGKRPPAYPMLGADDPPPGANIRPMPGQALAGADARGQPPSGWTVETGRPQLPATSSPAPPASFAMSEWKPGRRPARHTFGDQAPLQTVREASGAGYTGTESMFGDLGYGSADMQQSLTRLPWLPTSAPPSGPSPASQAGVDPTCPDLMIGRGWPGLDFPGPLPTFRSGTHPCHPEFANDAQTASPLGAPDAQGRNLGMPPWAAAQGQRIASRAGAPASSPPGVESGTLLGLNGVMHPEVDAGMLAGASALMPPAQFQALLARHAQRARTQPRPDSPEAAALLARIGLWLPTEGEPKHTTRSGCALTWVHIGITAKRMQHRKA